MLLTWSCVLSSWEWAQLEQLWLPGHLLLPDVMNLKEEKLSFPFSALKQAESLAQRKAQSHTSCDWVLCFLLQRYAETVQGDVRKRQISLKYPSTWGCASSEPTAATAPTLPLSGVAESAGHSCRGTLEHSKEFSAASAWPSCTELFKTPLKTYSGRPAVFIT